ncbi:beta-galactosidase [Pedobacter westerhofensis]|uniref:Beta-galactosidase n=1 Tax=Pedobacter westerhofensis TaxID=425512 RepID=A0A521CT46_9SPHI|nr:beta-galactosidase [Pedobacter westerhofensis]SMO61810.1 beta-galactosidase [Pedobacter westerhofensis]
MLMRGRQSMSRSWQKAAYVLLLLMKSAAGYSQALTDDPAVINDHMFPAKPAAKPFSDFDSKGFLINAKRTFLVSAGIEYARVPHQLWADRLLRLKRGGFNCVEIYTIWNFHEPLEGKFDFSGDQDLDGFLALVKKMEMYAIVRVGPYYCAEWDQGGYPVWLRFKPGLRVREPNAVFEKYVDRFFDRLLPVVFKHQINKGGAVVLIQLENEHPKGWGTIVPDQYFRHLQDKALHMGMEVPYFFSGLHHSTDPAGNGKLDDAARHNPWFSTEYWSMWYTQYGAKNGDAAKYGRSTWKIIANGGNGYNIYMAYGGSNFGYTNNDEDAASYDYGAAVGQAGDLRPIYYTFKRAAYFARSFQGILENSTDATQKYQYLIKKTNDTAVRVVSRTSAAGDLIFLDNPGHQPAAHIVSIAAQHDGMKIHLAAGEIYPIVHNFRLNSSVTIDWALSRVYGLQKQNHTTTIVLQAEAGEEVFMQFLLKDKFSAVSPNLSKTSALKNPFKVSGNRLSFTTIARAAEQPQEYVFKAGGERIRILVMNRAGTDQAWFIENVQGIITGLHYVSDAEVKKGRMVVTAESPLSSATLHKTGALLQTHHNSRIYLEKTSLPLFSDHKQPATVIEHAARGKPVMAAYLSAWMCKSAALSADPEYDDSRWLSSENPLQMGADQDITADAWYRTRFSVPESGKYSMQAEGGDRGTIFIDGKPSARWMIKTGEVSLHLDQGEHNMAIFTAHNGRDKMAAYLGPIDNIDKKGLDGKVLLRKGGPFYQTLQNWYFMKAPNIHAVKSVVPALDTLQWKKYKIGADAFDLKEGFGWFATVIPAQQGLNRMTLSFKSVDENATVFINGKEMIHRVGWNIPFEFTICNKDILSKPMVLTVFVENHDKEGGIDQAVKINTIGDARVITGWKMRGGPDEEYNSNNTGNALWSALKINPADTAAGPQYYRSSFTLPAQKDTHLIWRVNTTGMGHGSVWVNGHHIGRYPELNGEIGMYIPEPWLKTGDNELLVYEEEGKQPSALTITAEHAAGRKVYHLISQKILK